MRLGGIWLKEAKLSQSGPLHLLRKFNFIYSAARQASTNSSHGRFHDNLRAPSGPFLPEPTTPCPNLAPLYIYPVLSLCLRETLDSRNLRSSTRVEVGRLEQVSLRVMDSTKALESGDLYTVGWIAALPLERAAATAMLDERHEKPHDFVQPRNDPNSYTWGRIGEHNVVITSLAAGVYGETSAATTAMPMLSSFPQIRIGLLVGIGAGVASPGDDRDIRLGDIAVSQPTGNTGGVIQYDLIKMKPDGERESRAFLNRPPEVLLKALGRLQAEHELAPSKVPEYLERMVKDFPRMATMRHGYVHQGFENDHLFEAKDSTKEIQRMERDSTEPEIHYGTIASGNTLFKDAIHRDDIVQTVGDECICLEMEAAGLMNSFPCIVIRGICDYADSHKNDRWQRYAAATASAYAKEYLGYVPSYDLRQSEKATDILDAIGSS